MEPGELIERARAVLGEFRPSDGVAAGSAAAAILTADGHVYTGVCIDAACGLGFCAEHAAAAEMLKARESHVALVVAVSSAGPIAPCGRCRELLWQLDARNRSAGVILGPDRVVPLAELLPEPWGG